MTELKYRKGSLSGSSTQIMMGSIVVGLAILLLFMNGSVLYIGLGIFLIVTGIWNSGRTVVSFQADHLSVKIALLASRHYIFYRDMESLEEVSAKKVFLHVAGKRMRLPLVIFEEEDSAKLLQLLREKIAGNSAAS